MEFLVVVVEFVLLLSLIFLDLSSIHLGFILEFSSSFLGVLSEFSLSFLLSFLDLIWSILGVFLKDMSSIFFGPCHLWIFMAGCYDDCENTNREKTSKPVLKFLEICSKVVWFVV